MPVVPKNWPGGSKNLKLYPDSPRGGQGWTIFHQWTVLNVSPPRSDASCSTSEDGNQVVTCQIQICGSRSRICFFPAYRQKDKGSESNNKTPNLNKTSGYSTTVPRLCDGRSKTRIVRNSPSTELLASFILISNLNVDDAMFMEKIVRDNGKFQVIHDLFTPLNYGFWFRQLGLKIALHLRVVRRKSCAHQLGWRPATGGPWYLYL